MDKGREREREQAGASEHGRAAGAETGHGVSSYRFCAVAAMAVWQDSVYARSVAKTMRDTEGSIEPLARLFSDSRGPA
jgi:hypothetical protein